MRYLIVWTYFTDKSRISTTEEYAESYEQCAEIVDKAFQYQVESARTVGGISRKNASSYLPMPQVYLSSALMISIEEDGIGEDMYPEPTEQSFSEQEYAETDREIATLYAKLTQ